MALSAIYTRCPSDFSREESAEMQSERCKQFVEQPGLILDETVATARAEQIEERDEAVKDFLRIYELCPDGETKARLMNTLYDFERELKIAHDGPEMPGGR